MFPFFTILKNVGLFRVTDEMEVDGLDASKHGGSACDPDVRDSSGAGRGDAAATTRTVRGDGVGRRYKIDLEAMNTPTDVNRKPPAVHLEKDVVHS